MAPDSIEIFGPGVGHGRSPAPVQKYSPDQKRDYHGRFACEGGGAPLEADGVAEPAEDYEKAATKPLTVDQMAEILDRAEGDYGYFSGWKTTNGADQDQLLADLARLNGFDGLPMVVDVSEFEAVSGGALYRGIGASVPKAKAHVEAFLRGDYFAGRGLYGNGTYVVGDRSLAAPYGKGILELKLVDGAVVVSAKEVKKAALAYTKKLLDSMGESFGSIGGRTDVVGVRVANLVAMMNSDNGRAAMILGFDAIDIAESDDPESVRVLVILNRSAVIAKDTAKKKAITSVLKYSPDQARDWHGRFSSGSVSRDGGESGFGEEGAPYSKEKSAPVELNNRSSDVYRQLALLFDNEDLEEMIASSGERLPEDITLDELKKRFPALILATTREAERRIEEQAQKLLSAAHVAVRVPVEALLPIFDDGRLKTQFEVGVSRGDYDPKARALVENDLYGIPKDQIEGRPVYGFAFEDIALHGVLYDGGRLVGQSNYGTVSLVLKDDVKDRSTFTSGDSLFEYDSKFRKQREIAHEGESASEMRFTPVPMNSKADARLGFDLFENRYFLKHETMDDVLGFKGSTEVQVHGGVKLSDIEKVVIHWDADSFAKLDGDLLNRYKAAGIKVALYVPKGSVFPDEYRQWWDENGFGERFGGNKIILPTVGSLRGRFSEPVDAGDARPEWVRKYSPEQARDYHGRWTSDGGSKPPVVEAVVGEESAPYAKENLEDFSKLSKEGLAKRTKEIKDEIEKLLLPVPPGFLATFETKGTPLESGKLVWIEEDDPLSTSAAATVLDVMKEMRDGGYALPHAVMVEREDASSKSSVRGETAQVRNLVALSKDPFGERFVQMLTIAMPRSIPSDADINDVVKLAFGGKAYPNSKVNIDKFSGSTLRDIIVHEFGHIQVDTNKINVLSTRTGRKFVDALYIARTVSQYAEHNANEFIAETFVRLYRGEKLSAEVMQLYADYGGPSILPRKSTTVQKYSPDQKRDYHGRFAYEGGSGNGKQRERAAPVDLVAEAARLTEAIRKLIGAPEGGAQRSFVPDDPLAVAAATAAMDVLAEMKSRGYTMPHSFGVGREGQVGPYAGPHAQTAQALVASDSPSGWSLGSRLSIFIPTDVPNQAVFDDVVNVAFSGEEWDSRPDGKVKIDMFTVRSARDLVLHEMGHVQVDTEELDARSRMGDLLFGDVEKKIARKVSAYAGVTANEFIAETFVRLYRGETLSDDVMELYRAYGGPEIRPVPVGKYSPDQARDYHGRWTSEGGAVSEAPPSYADIKDKAKRLAEEISLIVNDGKLVFSKTEFVYASANCVSAAESVKSVLREMAADGYVMPEKVIVQQDLHVGSAVSGETAFSAEPSPAVMTIFVPRALPDGANLDDAVNVAFSGTRMRQFGSEMVTVDKFAVRTMRDVVIHELGHVQVGWLNPGEEFWGRDKLVANSVSEYATSDANEFVAETFLRLYRGEKLSDEVMKLYRRFRGAEIRPHVAAVAKYRPDQARDYHGRWTYEGDSRDGVQEESAPFVEDWGFATGVVTPRDRFLVNLSKEQILEFMAKQLKWMPDAKRAQFILTDGEFYGSDSGTHEGAIRGASERAGQRFGVYNAMRAGAVRVTNGMQFEVMAPITSKQAQSMASVYRGPDGEYMVDVWNVEQKFREHKMFDVNSSPSEIRTWVNARFEHRFPVPVAASMLWEEQWAEWVEKYSPDQARDYHGRWTSEGDVGEEPPPFASEGPVWRSSEGVIPAIYDAESDTQYWEDGGVRDDWENGVTEHKNYTPPPITHRASGSGYWGGSHGASFAATGMAAELMGIPGYDREGKYYEGRWAKPFVEMVLSRISADGPGSEEVLYHGFENVRGTRFSVGDTMRLPLMASSGASHGYGAQSEAGDQRGEPTVFVFEKGTQMSAYGGMSLADARDGGYKTVAEANQERGYVWDEAIIAGGFVVMKTERRQFGKQFDRKARVHVPLYGRVVYLRQAETFDPVRGWIPRG